MAVDSSAASHTIEDCGQMCGIAGIIGEKGRESSLRERALSMAGALTHRGPDDHGTWVDADAGVALAHRRLSIIDLSPDGRQPMASASGRFQICFNGEVYNFKQLREQLTAELGHGPELRGGSDTAVMLAAIEHWGVRRALDHFVGMFAFALWDARDRKLTLVRDRLGIKPLFWGFAGKSLVFGSELGALERHPAFERHVSPDAVAAYMRFAYVPAPATIYAKAHKLEPGTMAVIHADRPHDVRIERWWSASDVVARARANPYAGRDEDAVFELDVRLRDAVGLRMIADVPLGAFLSGGVDSSTVVALMQARSTSRVRTFTIGFEEREYDESAAARAVAEHLGTDHTELRLSGNDVLNAIPDVLGRYTEPFADSSQLPTTLVSRLARRHVTVALSGDGGDELFGGYTRHHWGPRLHRVTSGVPRNLRHIAADLLEATPTASIDRSYSMIEASLPPAIRLRLLGQKIRKAAQVLRSDDAPRLYRTLCSQWQRPLDAMSVPAHEMPPRAAPFSGTFGEQMMYLDMTGYLPDDILTKVDIASMSVGLEARVPLLDHRVVEFAWSLPAALRVGPAPGKRLLRRVLNRYVPPAITDRPKMGFSMPVGEWLRGPLKPWADDLLSARSLAESGVFDPGTIGSAWREHNEGGFRASELWAVLVFQSWWRTARPTLGS